jgi:hypothetical protein
MEVETERPTASPDPSLRFEVEPFRSDGSYSTTGAVALALWILACGVGLGWLTSYFAQWFYLLLIIPVVLGFLLAGLGWLGVTATKVHNGAIAFLIGLAGGFVVMTAMHCFDYHRFVQIHQSRAADEPNKDAEAVLRAWAEDKTFWDFLKLKAEQGDTIRWKRGFKLQVHATALWVCWVVECLLVGAIAGLFMNRGDDPFCARCQTWKVDRKLGRLHVPAGPAVTALKEGALGLFPTQATHDGATLELHASVCPSCGAESPVDVRLRKITKNAKEEETEEEVAHVTYPGRALPVLEALAPRKERT